MNEKLVPLHQLIRTICLEKINLETPETVDEQLGVEEAYELDSISMLELTANLEETYGCKIPDAEIASIGKMNLPDLLAYLERMAGQGDGQTEAAANGGAKLEAI